MTIARATVEIDPGASYVKAETGDFGKNRRGPPGQNCLDGEAEKLIRLDLVRRVKAGV
jgi:hypothetical protein